jgi:hypothetical protein
MKRYFLLSALLHCFVFTISFNASQKQEERNQGPGDGDKEGSTSNKPGTTGTDFDIIEISAGEGKLIKDESFYWGLGFTASRYSEEYHNGLLLPIAEVGHVASGYCGEEAGLKDGDIVYLINGNPISYDNDFTGDGPKKLVLTIYRNGGTVILTVERCKVYY